MQENYMRFGITDIAVNSWKILKDNFAKIVIPFILPTVLQTIGISAAVFPAFLLRNSGLNLGASIIMILGLILFCWTFWENLLVSATVSKIVCKTVIGEENINFKAEKLSIMKHAGTYINVLIMQSLIYFSVILLSLLIFLLAIINKTSLILLYITIIAFAFPLLVIIGLYLSLTTQTFALNTEMKAGEIIKLAINLVKGNVWNTLFMWIMIFGTTIPLIIIMSLLGSIFGDVVKNAFEILCTIVITPLSLTAGTLWYIKLKNNR